MYLLDKCDLNVTPLSFIVKCNYASKIKSTLRMQPSDWLKQVMLDENQNMTKVSVSTLGLKLILTRINI